MSFCVSCGKQAEDQDVFCIGCGQKLRNSDAQVSAPVKDEQVQPIENVRAPTPSQSPPSEVRRPVETSDEIMRGIRGKVGFQTSTASDKVSVDLIFPRTPADRAGLARGDVIVGVSGVAVESKSDFVAAIQGIDVGHLFTLTVVRDEKSLVLTVDPTTRPGVAAPKPTNTAPAARPAVYPNPTRTADRRSAKGSLFFGVIFVIGGIYFGTYTTQNYACNLASALGVKQPVSCAWYIDRLRRPRLVHWLRCGPRGLWIDCLRRGFAVAEVAERMNAERNS